MEGGVRTKYLQEYSQIIIIIIGLCQPTEETAKSLWYIKPVRVVWVVIILLEDSLHIDAPQLSE